MLRIATLLFFFIVSFSLSANIDYEDQFPALTLVLTGTDPDGNNIYTDNQGLGQTVLWVAANNRWEAQFQGDMLFFSNVLTGDGNPPPGTVADGTWVKNNAADSNTDVTIGGTCASTNILPVTLSSFTAELSGKTVALNWVTSEELDNERFDVERISLAGGFVKIGEVAGFGNSFAQNSYEFYDAAPLAGKNYYRLRQVDYDGQFALSGIVVVNNLNAVESQEMLLSPNPIVAASQLTVNFFTEEVTTAELGVFNMMGQRVMQQTQSLREGNNRIRVSLGDLTAGNYVVRVDAGGQVSSQKLVVK